MLIIKEIDFTQRKVIGLETDGELIEVNLTETKLKLVFSKDNIVVEKEIEKVKDEDKVFDVIVEEEVKEEIKEEVEEIKEIVKEEFIEPEIEVIHLDKMKKVFKEMFLYNEDKMLGAERVFKYRKIKLTNDYLLYDPLWVNINLGGVSSMDKFLYGSFGGKNNTKPYKKMYSFSREYKSGIEILGMKPRRTKDGKYKYHNISGQDLKDKCKKNGIKGYSKCDKTELVKLLMKVDS
jgi:hypothetical protein